MTLLKKNLKQVSLDFKALSADTSSQIEMLDREASLQNEKDLDDDCEVVLVEDNSENAKNQKIDRFFKSLIPSTTTVLRSCEVSIEKCDAEVVNKNDSGNSGSMGDDDELHVLSSSESEREEDSIESLEESIEEDDEKSKETTTTDAAKPGEDAAESDKTNAKKKRRTSSQVQAERKQKELDKARRRVEREAARLRRQEEIAKVKEEKKKEKDRATAEREALKQQVEKEKEEKRLKREEAKKERDRAKEEERLRKEDEKQKKEDERRKREEEKQEKLDKMEQAKKEKEEAKKQEEEELRKKKEKQAKFFNQFFIKSKLQTEVVEKEEKEAENVAKERRFGVLQMRKGMRLAPRRQSLEMSKQVAESLDEFIKGKTLSTKQQLYIGELQSGRRKKLTVEATWPMEMKLNEVQCLGSNLEERKLSESKWHRVKLLQFCENTRPAFYGTFKRRSHIINGRMPFSKDEKQLDYEIDSDEEWDEDPGESLSHSENEDEDGEEDQDEDDGFFVPHGYLSEDEGADDDEERISPEMRKLQQQLSEQRFEASMKKKIQPLVNVVIPPSVEPSEHPLLASFKVIEMIESFPIPVSTLAQTPTINRSNAKNGVPDEAMPDIVRLVHRNKLRMKKLLFEFRMFWEHKMTGRLPEVTYEEDLKGRDWKEFSISKSQLEKRIKEIAKYESDDVCWRVMPETLTQYPTEEENTWKYVTNVLEITRKKRQSSPVKPALQTSPEKKEIKKVPASTEADKVTPKTVEGSKKTEKTPPSVTKALKELKAKLLEDRKKPKSEKEMKTPPRKSSGEGGTTEKSDKMSPKDAKETAKREAMLKLKTELLKETTKVFTDPVVIKKIVDTDKSSADPESKTSSTAKSPKTVKKVRRRSSTPFSNPKVQKKKIDSKEKNKDSTSSSEAKKTESKEVSTVENPNNEAKVPKKKSDSKAISSEAKGKPKTPKKKTDPKVASADGNAKPKTPAKKKQIASANGTKAKNVSTKKAKAKAVEEAPKAKQPKTQKRRRDSKVMSTEEPNAKSAKPEEPVPKTLDSSDKSSRVVPSTTGESSDKLKDSNEVSHSKTATPTEDLQGKAKVSEKGDSSAEHNATDTKPSENAKVAANGNASNQTTDVKPKPKFSVNWSTRTAVKKKPEMESISENEPSKVAKAEVPSRKSTGGEKKTEKKAVPNGRPLKRLSVDNVIPMKLKLPTKKPRIEKENSEDDCEIIDLIDV